MIDSCDPDIACWSDDGTTFVVKDPSRFERTIIPQFFKHSKFSSLRQLNFYSFRKIKYADTIRIDPKLEAETANYWRFRHEHFQRGKPELLSEIKRMNGHRTTTATNATVMKETKPAPEQDKHTKSEVNQLKKRIEEMTKNIDELTAMVQKVSLKQEEQEENDTLQVGNKRKKVDPNDELRPDEMFSTMELEEMPALDLPEAVASMPPMPETMPMDRETSQTSQGSDNSFVDKLFNHFSEDDEADFLTSLVETPLEENDDNNNNNRPDPELMKRLSDALMLLPREIQEMIVERLITAITSTDTLQSSFGDISQAKKVATSGKSLPPQTVADDDDDDDDTKPQQEVHLPLAAATLAALLHHYSAQVQEGGKKPKDVQKTIPVIPVHA